MLYAASRIPVCATDRVSACSRRMMTHALPGSAHLDTSAWLAANMHVYAHKSAMAGRSECCWTTLAHTSVMLDNAGQLNGIIVNKLSLHDYGSALRHYACAACGWQRSCCLWMSSVVVFLCQPALDTNVHFDLAAQEVQMF